MRSYMLYLGIAFVPMTTPAAAISYVGSQLGAPDPGGTGNLLITFDDPLPAGITFTPGSTYSILQGTVPHRGYAPAGDLSAYLSVPGRGTSGSAILDFSGFSGTITGFSFYWGSIDRANELKVTTSLGTLDLFGSQVVSSGYGNATSAGDNRRVFFSLLSGERLEAIRFSSPTAFEVDDISLNASPGVPEPASWMMVIAGFGAIGRGMRKRREKKAPQPISHAGALRLAVPNWSPTLGRGVIVRN